MTSGNINANKAIESGQRIDAIKQLIFGENMVEYDERFNEVIDQLKATQKTLEKRIIEVEKLFNKALESLEAKQEKKMAASDKSTKASFAKMDDSKADRKSLG